MRVLIFLFLLINVWLFTLGQGFFGLPPSEKGRSLQPEPLIENANIHIKPIR